MAGCVGSKLDDTREGEGGGGGAVINVRFPPSELSHVDYMGSATVKPHDQSDRYSRWIRLIDTGSSVDEIRAESDLWPPFCDCGRSAVSLLR